MGHLAWPRTLYPAEVGKWEEADRRTQPRADQRIPEAGEWYDTQLLLGSHNLGMRQARQHELLKTVRKHLDDLLQDMSKRRGLEATFDEPLFLTWSLGRLCAVCRSLKLQPDLRPSSR